MKNNQTLRTAVFLLLLAGIFTSCDRKEIIVYEGSWKLAGVLYHNPFEQEWSFVELDPKDCDTCFTLTFTEVVDGHRRVVLEGISILNTVRIVKTWPRGATDLNLELIIADEDEPYDGSLYTELLRRMFAFYVDLSTPLNNTSRGNLVISIVENNVGIITLYFNRIEKK
jgi:hypothetical protein